jgi:choline dehydrogenase-like flavoprotein
VAVVGSGASGLAAAFRLREAGYRVRVLERGHKPGGRMSTVRRDGFAIEEGPSGLTRGHRGILGIVEDAGLGGELVEASSLVGIADRGTDIHLLDAQHIIRDAVRTRLVSTRAKLALTMLIIGLVRYRGRIDIEDLSRLASIDHLSAERYARRRYGDEAFEKVLEVDEGSDSVRVSWRDGAGAVHEETVAGVALACDAQAAERMHRELDDHRRMFLRDGVRFRPLVRRAGPRRTKTSSPRT